MLGAPVYTRHGVAEHPDRRHSRIRRSNGRRWTMPGAVERSWSWSFAAPPELLWPVLADTARINEATGFPRYVLEETAQPDGSVVRIGHAKMGPFAVVWDENPYDFVENRWLRQTR